MIESLTKGRKKGSKDKKARKKRNLKSLISQAFRSKTPEKKEKEPQKKFPWESNTDTSQIVGIHSITGRNMGRK